MLHFALTIFVSAFLLFQVQPLIGKIILPWFGGTPAVWNTCMVFFQVLLLGGYAYAHWSIEKLTARKQGLLHLMLLALAVAVTVPTIEPAASWQPSGTDSPIATILVVLAVAVGLPYFTLSATGSLLQAWFARSYPGRSPYPLYALSNAGSLLGLLTFPFIVEPALGSPEQASMWFWGYAAFAILCCAIAVRVGWSRFRSSGESNQDDEVSAVKPSWGTRGLWTALAASGSIMLLATTNQIALDVASVPFLWVVPLSLYLLTFVLCFSSESRYPRVLFYPLFVIATITVAVLMLTSPGAPILAQIIGYNGALFVFVMVCHGELYRLRPHPRYLTSFYLALSLGGALGGVLVGLVAPYVFNHYYELHLCLLGTPLLVLYAFYRDQRLELGRRGLLAILAALFAVSAATIIYVGVVSPGKLLWVIPLMGALVAVLVFGALLSVSATAAAAGESTGLINRGRWRLAWGLPIVAVVGLAANLREEVEYRVDGAVAVSRGFFGVLRAVDRDSGEDARRVLFHGSIEHGFQYLAEDRQRWHTSYFAEESGVGLALRRHPTRLVHAPLHIGLLGLGSGTLLTYGEMGDTIRIYEIDREVEQVAREHFTHFDLTRASTEVVLGDGRLSLEREPNREYDIIILDAFSSDAIPMHLLTREAFETYFRHLQRDGILAANMSNRHVDIKPVLKRLAQHFGTEFVWVPNWSDTERGVYGADWGLLTNNPSFLSDPTVLEYVEDTADVVPSERMWTDDYTNLLSVLK